MDGGQIGDIQVTWEEGQTVTVEIVVTANHRGQHELRFCEDARGGNSCLAQNVATAISHPSSDPGCPVPAPQGFAQSCMPSSAEQRSLFINDNVHTANYTFTLPENFTCEHCNMQWWWITANYGGEFFKSCHDIAIVPRAAPTPAPPTNEPTPSPPTQAPPPTNPPTTPPPTTPPTTPPPTACVGAWGSCAEGSDPCCAGHTCMGSEWDRMCYPTP
jgi:hypothetical protein